jgi:hypothetical protein
MKTLEGEKVEGATAVKHVAPSKSSRKFYRVPGQSGDPTALRLIASSKLSRTPATSVIQFSVRKSREAFANSKPNPRSLGAFGCSGRYKSRQAIAAPELPPDFSQLSGSA